MRILKIKLGLVGNYIHTPIFLYHQQITFYIIRVAKKYCNKSLIIPVEFENRNGEWKLSRTVLFLGKTVIGDETQPHYFQFEFKKV